MWHCHYHTNCCSWMVSENMWALWHLCLRCLILVFGEYVAVRNQYKNNNWHKVKAAQTQPILLLNHSSKHHAQLVQAVCSPLSNHHHLTFCLHSTAGESKLKFVIMTCGIIHVWPHTFNSRKSTHNNNVFLIKGQKTEMLLLSILKFIDRRYV